MSSIIRISAIAKAKIASIASSTGRPMTDVVDEAVDALERRIFMEEFNREYAEIRADPKRWAQVEADRDAWDQTVRDDAE